MRCNVVIGLIRGVLLMLGLYGASAKAGEAARPPSPVLLTNLCQLRRVAEQETRAVHPIQIVAEVMDVDVARGLLALRDTSGLEFIRVDFSDRDLEPGAWVCFEGKGCTLRREGFGLVVVPGMMLDGSQLTAAADVRLLGKQPAPASAEKKPSSILERNDNLWVTLEGAVARAGIWTVGGELLMRVGNDHIRVEVFEGGDFLPGVLTNNEVRASGIYQNILTAAGARVPGRLLVLNWKAIQPADVSEAPATVAIIHEALTRSPVLSTAAEVKALSSEMAKRQLPVSIRGVVTTARSPYPGAVIQDSTRGVCVDLRNLRGAESLRRGESYQIDGVTGPGCFSPVVVAHRITHLGPGQLPAPLRATRARLVNGSLDTQYAEIEGVVTAVQDRRLGLLTEGGEISIDLSEFQPEALRVYENALIRIRGCFFASLNLEPCTLGAASLAVGGPIVEVLESAPADCFDVPRRSIGELLFDDSTSAPFRRMRISGQVVHSRPGECYLTDGTNGVSLTTGNCEQFEVGDLVDAVGFLEPGGQVAGFRDAVMRKTGHAPVPAPTRLPPDQLFTLKHGLILTGILAGILGTVLLWNRELQRKAGGRGRQLETQISNRERRELQPATEAERTRIARDLHDGLGTGLTELSLLASSGLGQFQDRDKIRDRFHTIAEKARALVSGLDVIVWAIDPRRNSLQSFAGYVGEYARELFSSTAIDCRLRIHVEFGTVPLADCARHSLFLAVKEALNNVIRHAAATKIELQISQVGEHVYIVISDNGRGFDWNEIHRGNGLANLQERLEAMNGECKIETRLGRGTTVRFVVHVPFDAQLVDSQMIA